MRRILFALALSISCDAAAQTPNAQALYVERRAMLEADSACRLFTPAVRNALQAGAWQARGALLRSGWTNARLAELESAAVTAARARRCDDRRTHEAAERVRTSFEAWMRLSAMRFAGGERTWIVNRVADAQGWRLRQEIESPRLAAFGLRDAVGADVLVLLLPLRTGEQPPPAAELAMRDTIRARSTLFEVPGRTAEGLEAGAPSNAVARRILARERRIEAGRDGKRCVVFVFPAEALDAMAALDPREAVEARMGAHRVLIEVGDIAAARAFLAAQDAR